MSIPPIVTVLWPAGEALAQQCIATPTQTNQICTNSIFLSGGATGLGDTATLQATNTETGTLFGTTNGVSATTVNLANFGAVLGNTSGVSGSAANIVNSGSITGTASNGIGAATVTLTNSGTVWGGQRGMSFSTGTITNTGTIWGNTVYGISGPTLILNNSGIIFGAQRGISGATMTVVNSGSISGAVGIFAGGGAGADITNSGSIVGTGGTAIQLGTAADTLTLLPGSRIVGAISLGTGANVVNVNGSGDMSWLVTLTSFTGTINGSGNAPFVIAGGQIATVDPTPFAMTDRVMMDFTRGISSTIAARSSEMAAGAAGTAAFAPDGSASRVAEVFDTILGPSSAYAGDDLAFKNPTTMNAAGIGTWARGFVGRSVQQGNESTLRATTAFGGGAIGVDGPLNPNLRLGLFVGGGMTRMNLNANAGGTDSDMVFGGTYGRYDWTSSFLEFALHGGHSRNTGTRNIASNAAPGGLETATGRYDGWFVSPEVAYGIRHALGAGYTLTPTARVRYVGTFLDGYTETGATANLTVDRRDIHDLEERLELALTHTRVFTPSDMLLTSVHIGIVGLQRLGDTTVNTVLLGTNLPFATPGRDSNAGIYGGVGFDWRMAQRISVFAAADATAMSDSAVTIGGKGGVRVAF